MCVHLCGLVRVCLYFFSPFFCCTDLRGFLVLYCYCYSRKTCPSPPKVAENLGLRVWASVAYPLSQRKVRFFSPFFLGTDLRKSGPKGQGVRRVSSFILSPRKVRLHTTIHVSAYCSYCSYYYNYICVLILLYMYPHTTIRMCPHTAWYTACASE
jgi:hypothetical protein